MVRDSVAGMKRWILVAIAVASCAKQSAWSDKKSPELTVGPHKVPIPAGWRDVAESMDEQLKKSVPAGMQAIVAEKAVTFRANIVFTWSPFPSGAPSCDEVAKAVNQQFQAMVTNVKAVDVEADKGCEWSFTKDNAAGTMAVRFEKDHWLSVQCMRAIKGDAAADQVCKQVLDNLHFPSEPAHAAG